ncbi:MAG: hypothetical protein H6Q51_1210 [Deltaproteobacteria bacterium]|jgi:hypothetical protein|nr:hypothetical protein [Deltaproteobacteria bacterium]
MWESPEPVIASSSLTSRRRRSSARSAVASKHFPPDSLHSSLRLSETLTLYVKAVFSILFLVGPTVVLVRVFSARNGEKTAQN